jgi:hypothetical protein
MGKLQKQRCITDQHRSVMHSPKQAADLDGSMTAEQTRLLEKELPCALKPGGVD